jgi:putative transposase
MKNRRSMRLQGYDYTQSGAYFVTICTYQRMPLFGAITEGVMYLNEAGNSVVACWDEIPEHFPALEIDAFVVMPNHIHGIIVINSVGAQYIAPTSITPAPASIMPTPAITSPHVIPNSLGSIVRSFKAAVTRHLRRLPNSSDDPIWQGNYHDHIIRDDADLNRIRTRIAQNAARWHDDRFFV